MKWICCLALPVALLFGTTGDGGPLKPRKPERPDVVVYGKASFIDRFEGQKRAGVIIIGDGTSYLGLYVFDRWGNCVARDDTSGAKAARDDLAVEWYPAEEAAYSIDVCNFGPHTNKFTLVIR
jgi:hypothetical protein